MPDTCPKCGQTHDPDLCASHNAAGRPCRKRPIVGGRVCPTHGGSAPQVRAAAEQRLRQREAVLAVETFGLPREIDPHAALLEELHRTAGAVEWLGAVVADLERGAVVWGVTRIKTGGEDAGTTAEAGVNTWVQLWQAERKHLVDVSKACAAAGIEERRIRLAESQGQLLAGVVRAVLDRLELSEAQRRLVSVVVPEEFRRAMEIGGGGSVS